MAKKFKAGIANFIDEFKNEDGSIKMEELEERLNSDFNKFFSSNQPNMDDLKAKAADGAVSDFIKGLGVKDVENVDAFNAYVKRLGSDSTELTEANGRLEAAVADWEKKYGELEASNKEANSKIHSFETKAAIGKKFKPEHIDDIFDLSLVRVNEDNDLDTFLTGLEESHSDWKIGEKKIKKQVKPGQGDDDKVDDKSPINPSRRFW